MSWPISVLGELVHVKGGKRLPKGEQYSESATEHAYIRVCDLGGGGIKTNVDELKYISPETQEKIKRYTISSEDVYISIAGSIGVVGAVPKFLDGANLTENAAKLVIKDKSKIDKGYLIWFLATAGKASINAKTKATSQPKLALFRIEELEIPLPPLKEQKRIAAILDKADAIRRKRQQAIQLADDFLRSVFLDMFGDPVSNPKGWEVYSLSDLTSKITDGTHKTPTYISEGIPFLSAKNIKNQGLDWTDTKFISVDEHQDLSKRCNPEIGDIILSKSGSLGTPAIVDVDREFSLFESAALLKPISEIINPMYLLHFLRSSPGKYLMLKSAKGVAIRHLHLTDLRQLQVILPPLSIQGDFAQLVRRITSLIRNLEVMKGENTNVFCSLSQKAFSGKL